MKQAYRDWREKENFEPSMLLEIAFYAGYRASEGKQKCDKSTVTFDEWLSIRQGEIDIELAENGADREMSFDSEVEYARRYQVYLDSIF